MQLTSCEFAAVRPPAPASAFWSARRRPPLTDAAAPLLPKKPAASSAAVRASAASRRRGDGDGAGTVDEGMAVLRRRIHELRAAECGLEPPEGWAAWEKESYAAYDASVCAIAGALQELLLRCRPGVGVALLAAVALSVPASALVLAAHLIDASSAIVSGLHP
ncbi:hypothetical protein ACP4OV_022400 [Aristida adscensionis]